MIKLYFPVKYVGITQGYKTSHRAIDLGWSYSYGGPNHEVIAPADGTVTYVKKDYNKTDSEYVNYGNYVKIDHGDGVTTLMAHFAYDTVCVNVGDKVTKGQKIGIMGNTGYSRGNHVHYEVIINGEKVNPLEFTYASDDYVVGTSTSSNYNILYEKGESSMDDKTIDNVLFKYVVPKSGMYKIMLNENEKLLIID